jgi:hypothetical protein
MRTVGTFADVYKQARAYLNDVSGLPTDPVVRLENGSWILESRLEPQENTVLEVSLEDFQGYWHYCFEDESFEPTDSDIADFVDYVNTNAATE